MGIENRDYVRNDDRRRSLTGSGAEYPAVRTIIIMTVAVYLAQIFITRPFSSEDMREMYPDFDASAEVIDPALQDEFLKEMAHAAREVFPTVSVPEKWLRLETDKVVPGVQVWRVLTSAFCHDRAGVWHILINMLLLYWFGRELESIYGTRAFAWFYVTAAIFASLAYMGLQLATGERIPAIGASGAVMAVMMVYAIFHPRDEIYVFFVIPVQIRFLLMIYVVYDLHPVLLKLSGSQVSTGIAHAAHLGGLLYGYIFWRTGFSLQGLWDRAATARAKSGSRKQLQTGDAMRRVVSIRGPYAKKTSAESNDLDHQVDRILAKISESGKESLNQEELAILEKASRKYSQRTSS